MLEKIIDTNIKKTYFIVNKPIDMKLYDNLYEQWYNTNHKVWNDFRALHNVETFNSEVLLPKAYRQKDEYVGYWFFKQRTDRRAVHIEIEEINIPYRPNSMIVINAKDNFKLINNEGPLPEMLTCFVYFNAQDQKKIKGLLSL